MSSLDGSLKQIEEIKAQFQSDSKISGKDLSPKAVEDLRKKLY